MVSLLAKANRWVTRLFDEPGCGVLDIARAEKLTSSYVLRVIYLAFLAPDIALAIARGTQPHSLTATRLLRNVPLPPSWRLQRERLGFADLIDAAAPQQILEQLLGLRSRSARSRRWCSSALAVRTGLRIPTEIS
jgi:hypothetical protein